MRTVISTAVLSLVAACTFQDEDDKAPVLDGDDVVVAEVNGEPITQYDVDRMTEDTLGRSAQDRLDAKAKKNLLESLVQSRAMAQAMEKELSEQELAALAKKVEAYREELLVKRYLATHTRPSSVSAERVEAYYREHPERFGAESLRRYELIATGEVAPGARGALIAALGEAAEREDWSALVQELRHAGHAVSLRHGEADDAVLDAKLRRLMARLPVGQSSDLTFIEGRAYVARILEEREVPAKPLAEVRPEIHKILSPLSLRESVEEAAQQVMEEAQVAYR